MFPPNMQLYYQLEVYTRAGKLVRRTRKYRARSFVVQYLQHIRGLWNATDEAGVADTGGVDETLDTLGGQVMDVSAVGGTVTYGTRVGTGTTAVTMTDNKLETEIAEGTGSGQLSHGDTTVSVHAEASGEASFTLTRPFSNNSGGDIVVTEVGVYCKSKNAAAADKFFMLVRDIMPSTVTVTAGQVLNVNYTIRVTT